MKVEKRNSRSKVKGSNKQLAESQKIFDIARVQQYGIKYFLCYDLIDNIYLFDHEGLIKKTSKSDLCTELEKVLHINVYVHHQNGIDKILPQLLMSWDAYVACAYRPYENVTFPLTSLKDTDVMVLGLHYWNLLKGHGLKELWMRVVLGIQHDIFHFI